MGNFLRHSYHKVSDEIVWNTVQDDLPVLKRVAENALKGPASSPPNDTTNSK